MVALAQLDPAHAKGRAAHGTRVLFLESDRHAVVRADDQILIAVGLGDRNQGVSVFNLNRNDAGRAGV